MHTYKTVIIEDNPVNVAVLRKIIKDHHGDLEIVAEANSIESAKEVLLKHNPDIALMDIELRSGSSFDLLADLHQTDSINFEIIFITAHESYDYTTKAIDCAALAFLTKPIDPEILRRAIEKAKVKQTKKIQIEQLLAKLQSRTERTAQIIIPTANQNKVSINISDITYFKADGQTTIVYFKDRTYLTAFCILGYFKKLLMNEEYSFFLIHHSFLVNVEQIRSFRYMNLEATFKNEEKIIASRRHGKDFKYYWSEYNQNRGMFRNYLNV